MRYDLERPLFVLATQNPIEQEGTYPLPEAQLDRFMFNVVIEYPTADEERRILVDDHAAPRIRRVAVVATGEEIERLHALVRDVPAADNVSTTPRGSCARRGRPARRRPSSCGSGCAGAPVRAPARRCCSARKARALLEGRSVVASRTSRAVALPVLRHRILVNFQAEADGIDADEIVRQLLTPSA